MIEAGAIDFEKLDICDSFMFTRVMTSHPELLQELLSRILGEPISRIEFPESEKTIKLAPNSHGIRMDVYLDDEDGTIYDVEMEKPGKAHWKDLLPKRSRYYQSAIDISSLREGKSYRDLRKSFVIFICLKDPFDLSLGVYTFRNTCQEETGLKLSDETTKVFVNTSGTKGAISPDLRNVFEYMNKGVIRDSYTESLDAAVVSARDDLDWRNDYMSIYFAMMDAEMEGREKGYDEGHELGLEQGLEQGRAQGKAINLIALALRKYRKGKTPAEAADELETPLPEVEAIYRSIEAAGPEADVDAIYECMKG